MCFSELTSRRFVPSLSLAPISSPGISIGPDSRVKVTSCYSDKNGL